MFVCVCVGVRLLGVLGWWWKGIAQRARVSTCILNRSTLPPDKMQYCWEISETWEFEVRVDDALGERLYFFYIGHCHQSTVSKCACDPNQKTIANCDLVSVPVIRHKRKREAKPAHDVAFSFFLSTFFIPAIVRNAARHCMTDDSQVLLETSRSSGLGSGGMGEFGSQDDKLKARMNSGVRLIASTARCRFALRHSQ